MAIRRVTAISESRVAESGTARTTARTSNRSVTSSQPCAGTCGSACSGAAEQQAYGCREKGARVRSDMDGGSCGRAAGVDRPRPTILPSSPPIDQPSNSMCILSCLYRPVGIANQAHKPNGKSSLTKYKGRFEFTTLSLRALCAFLQSL